MNMKAAVAAFKTGMETLSALPPMPVFQFFKTTAAENVMITIWNGALRGLATAVCEAAYEDSFTSRDGEDDALRIGGGLYEVFTGMPEDMLTAEAFLAEVLYLMGAPDRCNVPFEYFPD